MGNQGWRTVVTKANDKLSMRNNQMVIVSGTDKLLIPMEQIRELVITSHVGTITFPLLLQLAEQDAKVVFCDRKRNPFCELQPLYSNYEGAGRLMDQAAWTGRKKSAMWRQIVKMKIARQIELLTVLGLDVPEQLPGYLRHIEKDDETNREAMAAKLYYDVLFGKQFKRFASDGRNAGLNYGYTILLSAFNRVIAMMGYSTALGIHHCSRQNHYNFSCDMMEPFRPFVDRIVYRHGEDELDWEYQKELIGVLQYPCTYGNKITDLETAIQWFVRDVAKGMTLPRYRMEEVRFAETKSSDFSDV